MEAITESIIDLAVCVRNRQTRDIVFQVEDKYKLNTQDGVVIDNTLFKELKKLTQEVVDNQVPRDKGLFEWSLHIYFKGNHFWMTANAKVPVNNRSLKLFTEEDVDDWGVYFTKEPEDHMNDPREIRRLIQVLEMDLYDRKPSLTLFRGLPGSGKTTLAKERLSKRLVDVHFEADDFFTSDEGEYKFDPTKLRDAHLACQLRTRESLMIGLKVSVANTFVRNWELEPYIKMARELNLPVEIVECEEEFENIHGVPTEVIEKMKTKWEEVDLEKMSKLTHP